MFSFGQWFGFYVRSGFFYRIGIGILELSIAFSNGGSVARFVDGIMESSGEAAQRVMDEPMKTGHKLPVGFISLLNGQPAEIRVEVEANRSKFLGPGIQEPEQTET
jgi:hypothetical protein